MHLRNADMTAHVVVETLRPLCERIAVAGSIRRRRPSVNDIDLVIEPKAGKLAAIKERCQKSKPIVLIDGDLNYQIVLPAPFGIQLDIFFARPAVEDLFAPKPPNWGSILLCRTGSVAHNIWLIDQAKAAGVAWLPYEGVLKDGRIVAAETEEDIFSAIGVGYVTPDNRER